MHVLKFHSDFWFLLLALVQPLVLENVMQAGRRLSECVGVHHARMSATTDVHLLCIQVPIRNLKPSGQKTSTKQLWLQQ